MSLVSKAKRLAERAHHGQLSRYTKEPTIEHANRVAEAAARAGLPDYAVAAGYLHDVVEDCSGWDYEELVEGNMTIETIALVSLLTKWWLGAVPEAIKAVYTAAYYAAISKDPHAVDLKLLDRADNLRRAVKTLALKDDATQAARLKWVGRYVDQTRQEFAGLLTVSTNRTVIDEFANAFKAVNVAYEWSAHESTHSVR